MKDILFIFFNGENNTLDQWYRHPQQEKKTDLIEKIQTIGDIFLYNPVFYYNEQIQQSFKINDINFDVHCTMLLSQFKSYNYYFLISHGIGYMLANYFAQLSKNKIIGIINFDGGETLETTQKYVEELEKKYKKHTNTEIEKLTNDVNNNKNKDSLLTLLEIVKYHMYSQYLKNGVFQPECKTIIFNNIYDNSEININNQEYVKFKLNNKFKYNALFRNNKNVLSKWYVTPNEFDHFIYFGKENEIINEIKNITCALFSNKELYIVRHGQTDWNKKRISQGAGNDGDLNSMGISQAIKTGIYLKKTRFESGEFDLILSSPLLRARTTAKLIAKEIGYTKPITILNELIELDYGLISIGKTTQQMREDPFYDEYFKLQNERKKFDKMKRRELMFENEPDTYTKKYKMESTKNIIQRMLSIKNYILSHSHKKIIIVTHGGTIDWLNRILFNTADYLGSPKNCSIAYYKVENCEFKLLMASTDEHLDKN